MLPAIGLIYPVSPVRGLANAFIALVVRAAGFGVLPDVPGGWWPWVVGLCMLVVACALHL